MFLTLPHDAEPRPCGGPVDTLFRQLRHKARITIPVTQTTTHQLRTEFGANAYSRRIEGGYRVTALNGLSITSYLERRGSQNVVAIIRSNDKARLSCFRRR